MSDQDAARVRDIGPKNRNYRETQA
jgi:hypothetical protein